MHQINDAVVKEGRLELSHLPFADGQRVRVLVTEAGNGPSNRKSIQEIRGLLKGGVERFDEPFEPVIAPEHWEMLK